MESEEFTKFDLIRLLLKGRLCDPRFGDPAETNDLIDEQEDFVLLGTPEGSIVSIIEQFAALRGLGMGLAEAIQTIELQRCNASKTPEDWSLRDYIRYRVRLEHKIGPQIQEDQIQHSEKRALAFFSPKAGSTPKQTPDPNMSPLQEILLTQSAIIGQAIVNQIAFANIIANLPQVSPDVKETLTQMNAHNMEIYKLIGETGKKLTHIHDGNHSSQTA